MTLKEFAAVIRGFTRAHGGEAEATKGEIDDYRAALAEAERLGIA
ncbi:hypothetical protein [Methylocystis parvus]